MSSEGLREKLAALRERRARIDAEIKQLEAQLYAQERAGQKGAEVPGGLAGPGLLAGLQNPFGI